MESIKLNKLPIGYNLNEELIKLVGQVYEKLGEYKYALKTSKVDPKIILNLLLFYECYSSFSLDEEGYSFDDVAYMNYKKATKKTKLFKNLYKTYNYSIVEFKLKEKIDLSFINTIHKQIFSGIRNTATYSGSLRKKQNYITKVGLVGKSVIYVPPTSSELHDLMKNFTDYINESTNDELFIKLALIHYQFEKIHPYMHGNGYLGRVLISSLFVRYKNDLPILFISEALNNSRATYYSIFNENMDNEMVFIRFFLQSIIEQCNLNILKIEKLNKIYEEDLKIIKENTSGTLVYKMLPYMIKRIVFTVNDMINDTSHHINSVNKVLNILVDIGILEKDKKEGNNRKTYKYVHIYQIFK
jgi:Fic family protein